MRTDYTGVTFAFLALVAIQLPFAHLIHDGGNCLALAFLINIGGKWHNLTTEFQRQLYVYAETRVM